VVSIYVLSSYNNHFKQAWIQDLNCQDQDSTAQDHSEPQDHDWDCVCGESQILITISTRIALGKTLRTLLNWLTQKNLNTIPQILCH